MIQCPLVLNACLFLRQKGVFSVATVDIDVEAMDAEAK